MILIIQYFYRLYKHITKQIKQRFKLHNHQAMQWHLALNNKIIFLLLSFVKLIILIVHDEEFSRVSAYPEFYLKLTKNGPKTEIRHQTTKFDLAHDENSFRTTPGIGMKSLGLVFWYILASKH